MLGGRKWSGSGCEVMTLPATSALSALAPTRPPPGLVTWLFSWQRLYHAGTSFVREQGQSHGAPQLILHTHTRLSALPWPSSMPRTTSSPAAEPIPATKPTSHVMSALPHSLVNDQKSVHPLPSLISSRLSSLVSSFLLLLISRLISSCVSPSTSSPSHLHMHTAYTIMPHLEVVLPIT